MKLFISWSGEFSREIAEKLSVWIPSVLQSVDVFFSPNDIEKGENWDNRLTAELSECNYGIVCLTPQNVTAPWLHFEAGALSKSFDSRVSSLMIGVSPSDIKGPLSRFQNTKFDKKDFLQLIETINNCADKALNSNVLNYAFEGQWDRLAKDLDEIIARHSKGTGAVASSKKAKDSSVEDAVEEILSLVRKMSVSLGKNSASYYVETRKSPTALERALRHAMADDTDDHGDKIYRVTIQTKDKNEAEIHKILNDLDLNAEMQIMRKPSDPAIYSCLRTKRLDRRSAIDLCDKLKQDGYDVEIMVE